jgi:hypothetical protein
LQILKQNLYKKRVVALSLYTAKLAKNTKLDERENGSMRWQKIQNWRKREHQCETVYVQKEQYNLIWGHHSGLPVRSAVETVMVYF